MLTSLIPALCRQARDDETLRGARAQLATPDGRQAFVARAHRLRVLALTLSHLERDGILDELPADAAEELRSLLSRIRRAVGAQELERERVTARLRAAGIDAVLLKGAALPIGAAPRTGALGHRSARVARDDAHLSRSERALHDGHGRRRARHGPPGLSYSGLARAE